MSASSEKLKAADIAGQIVQAGMGSMVFSKADDSSPEKVFERIFDAVLKKISP